MCMYIHVRAGALWSHQRALDPLKLKVQAGMHHPMDTGIQLEPSAKEARSLTAEPSLEAQEF